MSYILDALKKSEKERKIGQVPTLHSVDVVEPVPASKSFSVLLVIIIVLLLVVVVLLYFQPGKIEMQSSSKNVVSEIVREMPTKVDVTQIPSQAQSTVEPYAMGGAEAQDIMEVIVQERMRKQQTNSVMVSAPVKTEAMPEQFNKELLKEGEILITPTSRKEAAEAKAKEGVTVSEDTSIPLLSETEYGFQTQLPEMHLDVHVYKKRPKDRFVLINMDKYREGQKMSSGVVIEAIVVDGVMMNYQGQRFLLPLN